MKRLLSSCLVLMIQFSADILKGDTNTADVATVLSLKVSLSRITPDETIQEEYKKRLDTSNYLAWLRDKRAQALLAIVEDKLFAEYARKTGVEPTEKDLAEHHAMRERASAELHTILTQKIAVARQELETGNLSESRRNELLGRLHILETHPLVSREGQTASVDKEEAIEQAHLFIRNRNVNRALFKQYGGRIKLNSIGYHEAIDATRRFLVDSENRGDFQIYDKEIRRRMWQLQDTKEKGSIVEGAAAEKAMLSR